MVLKSQDAWIIPSDLRFTKIHVSGSTNWVSIELASDDEIFGLGEITYTQLDPKVVPKLARLANRLRGQRIYSDDDVLQLCQITPHELETDINVATAISGLRCAVVDGLAKRSGLSMSKYLKAVHNSQGTPSRSVELYANINRSMLPNDQGLKSRTPESFAKAAKKAMDEGYGTIKCAPFDECKAPFIDSGLPSNTENGLNRIRAIKEHIGTVHAIYIDCHGRFDFESAVQLEKELNELDIKWFEEPVDTLKSINILKKIQDQATLPIAGGEMGYGIDVFFKLIDQEIIDIIMPDIKFCGGPAEAYRIGVEVESIKSGSVSMHCPSGPISLLASAHVTAAFNNILPLEHAVNEVPWRHEIMEPFEEIKNGEFLIPDGPGLGGRIDPVAIELRGAHWKE